VAGHAAKQEKKEMEAQRVTQERRNSEKRIEKH
jgi:hypothetical protein